MIRVGLKPTPTGGENVTMKYNPEKHHRRSVRLREYDYSQPGAYFVTICTWDRECIFGNIINGEMELNEYGRIIEEEWLQTGYVRLNVEIDQYVVMPNHIHGILIITENNNHPVGARRRLALALILNNVQKKQ